MNRLASLAFSDVIAEYKSATHMKATDLPYRNEYIGRFRIKDGKITVFAEYLDPTRFVTAVVGPWFQAH